MSSLKISSVKEETLGESLAKLRLKQHSDVVIVCNEVEFYVHRCVLEVGSQYFSALFRSEMEEATSNRITFKDMGPDVMKVILDFVYTGRVKDVDTVEELLEVAAAAHHLELYGLATYCCKQLLEALNIENCIQAWKTIEKIGSDKQKTMVADYLLANIDDIQLGDFLSLSLSDLKEFLLCASKLSLCTDKLLNGILYWVDGITTNEIPFKVLVSCIDWSKLSKNYIRSLCTEEMLKSTSETNIVLKEIGLRVLISDESLNEYVPHLGKALVPAHQCGEEKLLVITNKALDASLGSSVGKSSYQAFDLKTRRWLPPQNLPFELYPGMAVCQWGKCLRFIGGERKCKSQIECNIQYCPKTAKFINLPANETTPVKTFGSSLIEVNKKLYLIGGENFAAAVPEKVCNEVCYCVIEATSQVYCYDPLEDKWIRAIEMNFSHRNPSAVVSRGRTFVFNGGSKKNLIEYNDDMDSLPWTMVSILQFFSASMTVSCYPVAMGKVYAFCSDQTGAVVVMRYDPEVNMWQCFKRNKSKSLRGVVQVRGSCLQELVFYCRIATSSVPTLAWNPITKGHETFAIPPEASKISGAIFNLYVCGL